MTDVTHTNDTAVTSFEYNLKCVIFMTLNFHKKPQRDFDFHFFFKFLLFLIYFIFFALYFFSARRCARNCVLAYRELRAWLKHKRSPDPSPTHAPSNHKSWIRPCTCISSILQGLSWYYSSWIYNYLYNQCLSPLKL